MAEIHVTLMVTGQNVNKPKRRQPKRRQTETSTNRNVDRPKRRQTKTSTNRNVDKPKLRQTETSTNQNVDKPKRRQTMHTYDIQTASPGRGSSGNLRLYLKCNWIHAAVRAMFYKGILPLIIGEEFNHIIQHSSYHSIQHIVRVDPEAL